MLSTRLKAIRKLRQLSQEQLAHLVGIEEASASTRISQYERGVHEPPYKLMIKIAKVLDVPVAYFYADNDELAEIILKYHSDKKR